MFVIVLVGLVCVDDIDDDKVVDEETELENEVLLIFIFVVELVQTVIEMFITI